MFIDANPGEVSNTLQGFSILKIAGKQVRKT
jgi:hypothetical protein